MELIRGIPITEYCDQARVATRQRLELFLTVCRAVQHAHTKGIIHRDLKPSNVLVTMHDGTPVPKVIDFGVAKAIDRSLTDQSLHTCFAQLLGTPLYMSPEQVEWSNLDIDTRSDVYSLGVLLYELLTGATPFASADLKAVGFNGMRRIICEVDPPCPSQRWSTLNAQARSTIAERRGVDVRQVSRLLRGELDWIVMKALEKDRARRYESASAFADDIERYLKEEPVKARPAGLGRTAWKWCRRHRSAAALAAAFLAFLSIAFAGLAWHSHRLGTALSTSEQLRDDLSARERRLREEAYASDIGLAWNARQTGALEHARELLARYVPQAGETDVRGFEWHYLAHHCQPKLLTYSGHSAGILCADISPDDRWIASGDIGGEVKLWNLESGREVRSLRHSDKEVCAVRFHPHRPLLATAGQLDMIRLWNLEDGSEIARVVGHDGTIYSLAWSPDGARLASAARDGFVVIWDVTTPAAPKILARLEHGEVLRSVAWSPDGKLLASAGGAGPSDVWLWETSAWQRAGKLPGQKEGIQALAFDSTGRYLACGGYGDQVILFDVFQRAKVDQPSPGAGAIWSLAFLPQSPGSEDGLVVGQNESGLTWYSFDPATGRLERMPTSIRHPGKFRAILFTRNSRRMLTAAQESRTLKLWELARVRNYAVSHTVPYRMVAIDAARDRGLGGSVQENALWIFQLSTGKGLKCLADPPSAGSIRLASFSPDGESVATLDAGGRLRLWNIATGACRVLAPSLRRFSYGQRLAFSPDGTMLAVAENRVGVHLWMIASGARTTFPGEATIVAFSPDGRILVASAGRGGSEGEILCWRTDAKEAIGTIVTDQAITCVEFSADGKWLGVSGEHGVVLYDWPTGVEQARFVASQPAVQRFAFFPDGHAIVTFGSDGSVRLWSIPARRELFTLLKFDPLFASAIPHGLDVLVPSRDRLTVVSGRRQDNDHKVVVFDASEGLP